MILLSLRKTRTHKPYMCMYVYYILYENYMRADKNMKKDAFNSVLKAAWEAERLMQKEGGGE